MLLKFALTILFTVYSVLASEAGSRKSEELRDKILRSGEDIPTLNAQEYRYFVQESPRPYDVVVFFTGPSCQMCDEVQGELSKVATLYKQNGALYPYKDSNKRLRAVYFVRVLFEQPTREIFFSLNFKAIPNLLVSTPKMLRVKGIEKNEHMRKYLWQISMSDGTLSSHKLLDHVNKLTLRNVEYKESVLNLLIVLIVFGSVAALGVALFLKFQGFFLSTTLWFIGSMTVYFICMSGIIYNILHSVPFTNVDRNGNVEWYHSGARSQFGAEGYIMSGCISVLGILFISLFNLPKYSGEGGSRVLYIVVFIFIYLVMKFVEGIYKAKSGFYSPIFYPPAHYIKGPLNNDQGNNI